MQTLIDLLESFKNRGNREASVFLLGGNRSVFTYAEIYEHTLRLAGWLKQQGIGKGDRVVLWMSSSPLSVVCFFAVLARGAACVQVHHDMHVDEAKKRILHSDAKLLITTHEVDMGEFLNLQSVMARDLPEIIEQSKVISAEAVNPDDVAEICYTSGTTAVPKGVCLTHKNLIANIIRRSPFLPEAAKDATFLCTVVFSMIYGQVVGCLVPMSLGAKVVFAGDAHFKEIFSVWQKEKVSILVLVPAVLQTFKKYLEAIEPAGRKNLESKLAEDFICFCSAGSGIGEDVYNFWENLNMPILHGYGLTECSPVSLSKMEDRKFGTAGRPMPGVSVKIQGSEILVKGDNIFKEYWNNPQATVLAFDSEGWLKTGDLGKLEDGFLTVDGRREQEIGISKSETVMPSEIEPVINSISGVKDCCIIGKPFKDFQTLHAVLILEPNVDAGKVIQDVNKKLPSNRQIQSYSIWPSSDFPKNQTMKILRSKVESFVNNYSKE